MEFEITSGIVPGAKKIVFYGPEGIGKSTFASKFPDPLFIDTEGSTKSLNVKRLQKPTSWSMLGEMVKWVIQTRPCKTLVIDTADWAERLCIEVVCARYGKKGIEDFGYGNGYTYVFEEWGRFLNLLSDVAEISNINVVLTAHAIIRKFEQPNEMGAYDRYELKLGKKTTAQTAPVTKEWADMVLFANYKTFSVAADDKGKKYKAQGGQRVMYTAHHPCWDAKNRYGLADELPLDYSYIAHIFDNTEPISKEASATSFTVENGNDMKTYEPETLDAVDEKKIDEIINNNIPLALKELMDRNNVTEDEIRKAVAKKGYYPESAPISNYDPAFIDGVLVAAWSQILNYIENEIRPF